MGEDEGLQFSDLLNVVQRPRKVEERHGLTLWEALEESDTAKHDTVLDTGRYVEHHRRRGMRREHWVVGRQDDPTNKASYSDKEEMTHSLQGADMVEGWEPIGITRGHLQSVKPTQE